MTLPKGWAPLALRDALAQLRTGPFGSAVHKHDYVTGGTPLINPMHIVRGQIHPSADVTLPEKKASELGDFVLKAGDIILGRRGEMGRCAVVTKDHAGWLIGTGSMALTPSDALCSEYLQRFLSSDSVVKTLEGNAVGTTMVNLNQSILLNLPFPVPPLAEQRRIVAKLETLTARLTRARAELDRVQKLAATLRTATIHSVFERWTTAPVYRIEQLCRVGTGSTPKRGESRYYNEGTIAWVTSGEVNSQVVTEPTELITEAAIRETNCKVFPAGSLLVALYGEGKTRGKVSRLGIPAATNQAIAVLHQFECQVVTSDWIRLFLEARYEKTRSEAAGGVQPNLNLGIVKAIEIPLPPIAAQKEAIASLEIGLARADRLEAEARKARALLDRLESAVLARAFRGELVSQDPNDEPASALLARIRAQRATAPRAKRGRKAKA